MRGCAVARVLGWCSPEGFLGAPLFASLLGSLVEHVRHALVAPEEGRSDLVARNPLQIVDNRGSKFQVVPIRIDYRMVQAIMKRFGLAIARHDISPFPPPRPRCALLPIHYRSRRRSEKSFTAPAARAAAPYFWRPLLGQ